MTNAKGGALAFELSLGSGPMLSLRDGRRLFDTAYVQVVLRRCDGNVSATAKALGLNRSYLSGLLKQMGLR